MPHEYTDRILALDISSEKLCNSCGNIKPLDNFYRKKDGSYRSYCKKCASDYNKKWRANNKTRVREIPLEKTCYKCHKTLPASSFYPKPDEKDGLHDLCKSCNKIKNRNQRLQINEWIAQYLLNHPCIDCGESDIRVLEFDHVRGIKKFDVKTSLSKKQLIEEIAKCEIRCANCHRRRHYELRQI